VYNCIYDDETVISLEQGPCQQTLSNGAELVDAVDSGTEITVTTPEPISWGFWLTVAGLLWAVRPGR